MGFDNTRFTIFLIKKIQEHKKLISNKQKNRINTVFLVISNWFCTCKIIPQSWDKNIVKALLCPVIKAKNRGLVFGLKTIKTIQNIYTSGLRSFYKINQKGTQICVLKTTIINKKRFSIILILIIKIINKRFQISIF